VAESAWLMRDSLDEGPEESSSPKEPSARLLRRKLFMFPASMSYISKLFLAAAYTSRRSTLARRQCISHQQLVVTTMLEVMLNTIQSITSTTFETSLSNADLQHMQAHVQLGCSAYMQHGYSSARIER